MEGIDNTPIQLKHFTATLSGNITPPASKSESNRVLIINALTGNKGNLENLSNARDTQTMIRLLQSNDNVLDVIDAGTTMRFLTAYLSITGQEKVLTGTKRMCERPIKLLVDALKQLGAGIGYLQQEGYPPLEIKTFNKANVKTNRLKIKGDVSSQYITALLMIAPVLPQGMILELEGKIGSKPYIAMTLSLMKHFGINSEWKENSISIAPQSYQTASYKVESDWSAASYWFAFTALSENATIEILGYHKNSLQGDHVITQIMDKCGVKTEFTNNGLKLSKQNHVASFTWDFTDCPDLAQTIVVVCAAKGINCTLSGLESLRIKETDRIAALQNEIRKFGADLVEIEKDNIYQVIPGAFKVEGQLVNTYKDHRMAMAFAPLCLLGDVLIEAPEVTAKSYPHFWEDMKALGIQL
ncbi:MAG: 3-phosphoshikimate 1-carboxyvinyltransferase [Cytophagales bacterium]|nr:MAG: 3-phosphoshikimate 1-carboxyvinyltransferase [Cytophagales bacterium]